MDTKEKKIFIRELTKNVQKEILKNISKMPEDWDGVELRWYIAYRFGQVVFGGTSSKQRRKAFCNTILVNNL